LVNLLAGQGVFITWRSSDGTSGLATDRDADASSGAAAATPLTVARFLLPCHTASLGVSRMPATPRSGLGLALFLIGDGHDLAAGSPLTALFDVLVGELPGHGISHEVDDVMSPYVRRIFREVFNS
jgi:hypothetical protein